MSEPIWNDNLNDDIENNLARFFNWYNYHKSRNDAHAYLTEYIQSYFQHEDLLSLVQSSPATDLDGFDVTYCWLARIIKNSSSKIFEHYDQRLKSHLPKLASKLLSAKKERKNSRNNLEEQYTQLDETVRLLATGKNFLNKKYLEDFYHTKKEITQLKEIIEQSKDKNPNLLKTYESFLVVIDEYECAKKKTRKVRTKKVNPVKVVKKLSYLPKCSELDLESIDPQRILQSKFLLTFNVKTRQVGLLYALDDANFVLKGTTLQNLDEQKSFSKKIRKPKTILPDILRSIVQHGIEIKVAEIVAKKQAINGRINKHTLILRAH